jgi:hypothetical protein
MIRALAIMAALLLSTSVYAQTTTTTDSTTTTTKSTTTKHHHHKKAAMKTDSTMSEDMAATRPHAPGAQERALDAGQEPATKPDPQGDAEVRKLNGGM